MGYGLDVEVPLLPIPMVKSRIEATMSSGAGFSITPILVTGTYKPPLMPFYGGAGVGTVLYSRSDANFSVPTTMIYDVFVGYEQNFMPMSSYFVQVGYEVMRISYTLASVSYTADFTGMSVKGGVRFGI